MPVAATQGIDIGQITDLNDMSYYVGNGCQGNAISGHIHLANILNPSSQPVAGGVGTSTNGTLTNGPQYNTFTSFG